MAEFGQKTENKLGTDLRCYLVVLSACFFKNRKIKKSPTEKSNII